MAASNAPIAAFALLTLSTRLRPGDRVSVAAGVLVKPAVPVTPAARDRGVIAAHGGAGGDQVASDERARLAQPEDGDHAARWFRTCWSRGHPAPGR